MSAADAYILTHKELTEPDPTAQRKLGNYIENDTVVGSVCLLVCEIIDDGQVLVK